MGVPEVVVKPPAMIGRYALYGVIGTGGMATVHFGRLYGASGFARTVAIKRLHEHFASEPRFVASLLEEARLATRIRHPNVVSVLDVVSDDGQVSLVMEYVAGEALSKLTRGATHKKPTMPPAIASAIVSGVLHGLHAAHTAAGESGEPLHIVHRDVSPHNVLVGVDGVARLLDFGIAKAVGQEHATRDGSLKGKISYMAPEQARRASIDARTDVYAASVVLWELVTGHRLFTGDNEAAILEQVLVGLVDPPSKYVPSIDLKLEAVIMRGLEREPAKRFTTAREMVLALEAAMPPATPLAVSAWVHTMAGPTLARRAEEVATIERMPPPRPTGGGATAGSTWTLARRVVGLAAVIVGAAVAGGVAVASLRDAPTARIARTTAGMDPQSSDAGAAANVIVGATSSAIAPPADAIAGAASKPTTSSGPRSGAVPAGGASSTRPFARLTASSAPMAGGSAAKRATPPNRCESVDPATGDIHFNPDCR